MEGKRTAQAEASARRGGAAVWIGLAAAAVLAAAAGFCVYANTYSGVFPGVTMAGIELEGKGLKELRDTLTQALPSSLDGQEVTVTAGGETLGTYSLTELGRSFVPVLVQMMRWSEAHLCPPGYVSPYGDDILPLE